MEAMIHPAEKTVKVDYAIYPSLLDAFVRYKEHDDDETFAALFDKINKVKTPQTEEQLKGVAFESCINALIDGKDVELSNNGKMFLHSGFEFKVDLMFKISSKLRNCQMKQNYLECIVDTKFGKIKLYGIADYRFDGMLVDLKTTANYKINKYKIHTQHPVYSLIRKQMGQPLKAFKYVISDFENDYQETYIPTDAMHFKLMQLIYEFITFINYYKPNITNMKVFGGEEVQHA